jgi:hypothetical protein
MAIARNAGAALTSPQRAGGNKAGGGLSDGRRMKPARIEAPRPRNLFGSGVSWLVAGAGFAECYTANETSGFPNRRPCGHGTPCAGWLLRGYSCCLSPERAGGTREGPTAPPNLIGNTAALYRSRFPACGTWTSVAAGPDEFIAVGVPVFESAALRLV